MNSFFFRIALVLAGAFLAAPLQAQVYKCVDSKGRTVYLQEACPRGMKATTLEKKRAAPRKPAYSEDPKPGGKPRQVTPGTKFGEK